MDEVTKLLVATRDLLKDKDRWTQGAFARDRFGRATDEHGPDAHCHCTLGGVMISAGRGSKLYRPAHDRLTRAAEVVLRDLRKSTPAAPVIYVNDVCGYEPTMKMFDIAIAEAA